MRNPDKYKNVRRPKIIRECTACAARGGCMTDLVCHTAPLDNAISILKCGSLLSAAIEKYGFRKCGIIHVRNGSERIAYDYIRVK